MEIQEYRDKLIDIRDNVLKYLDDESNSDYQIDDLKSYLEDKNIQQNRHELNDFLCFLLQISNMYRRSKNFYSKIDEILSYFKSSITKFFSNFEIFNIFKKNKRILLFLLKNDILTIDNRILDIIMTEKYKKLDYPSYFYPEIKSIMSNIECVDQKVKELFESNPNDFEQKRENGENDNYICSLIRDDDIDGFVSFRTKCQISPCEEVKHSIFETNYFLLKRQSSLIEYAAFYGSELIFKHLLFSEAEYNSSLWLYSIHSRNPDMIHILEEKGIKPENEYYREYVIESIICHHNEIATYIQNNYITVELEIDFFIISKSMKYHNYDYFPDDLNKDFLFWELVKYNYESFVEMILKDTKIDFNAKIHFLFISYHFLFNF